jgi:arylsulfatase A-like enzyme
MFAKIGNNDVAEFLKANGYKYFYFGNWFEIGKWDRDIQRNASFYFNSLNGDRFSDAWDERFKVSQTQGVLLFKDENVLYVGLLYRQCHYVV